MNIKNAAASEGQVAPYVAGDISHFTATCSHTLQAIRAAKASLPSTDPKLTENGVYSARKITDLCPELGRVMERGDHY